MLAPIRHLIDLKRIVLASGSPRRHELVRAIGLNTELCPSTFEENLDPTDFKEFSDFVVATAMGKAEEVFERLSKEPGSDPNHMIVIAADTMVTLNNEVYGKPKDAQDAVRMLTKLSGTCNRVYTGVVLKYYNGARKFTETADVYFGNLTPAQIEAYVATGEPLDKAGAYGVQGLGGSLIARVEGDFYCVMGLPLHRLCYELSLYLEEDASSRALNLECH